MAKKIDLAVENLPYYHYRLHLLFAESLLERNGDFLLRDLPDDTTSEVVVRWGAYLKHLPVDEIDDGIYGFSDFYSRQLSRVIDHYVNTGKRVTASGPRLINPIPFQLWEIIGKATEGHISDSQQLGKGGFGVVHEIAFRKAGTDVFEIVAVKVVDGWSDMSADRKRHCRGLLLQEAKAVSDLVSHPNIVSFRGVFVDTEFPALVMDVLKGVNYRKDLRLKEGTTCMRGMLIGAKDAASAVAYMHQKGYIHRGITSRKFLIAEPDNDKGRGRLVLTGFRTARYVGNEHIYKSFSSSTGTPLRWTALESLMESIWLRESDVWSLGVLMWEIFTRGGSPYKLENSTKSAMVQLLRDGQRLEVPSEVPEKVAESMRSCWDVDIFDRPAASAIVNVLDEAIANCECTHRMQ